MKSKANDDSGRHDLKEERQLLQLYIDRRLKDSSKTESTMEKLKGKNENFGDSESL
jgi:hypothetical protein